MPVPITAIVLTKNEEHNLPECLASVAWADEMLVVDSFSSDGTVDLARAAGANVLQHAFRDYADQHNFAMTQARYDWVLFVDADERVSPELASEIAGLAAPGRLDECRAYHILRMHLFSGRWLFSDPATRKASPSLKRRIRQVEVPRLIDRRVSTWERPLHETVRAPEPHGVLEGVIYHFANTNLSATCESFNDYTDREAAYLDSVTGQRRVSLLEALARGLRAFLYAYLWWGWWRFGEQGLMYALQSGYTKYMNYAKLGERQRIRDGRGIWTEADRDLVGGHSADPSAGA